MPRTPCSPDAITRSAPTQQQELLDGGLPLLDDQPLGGLEHRGAGGVAVVVGADRGGVRPFRLGLGDRVEAASLGELEVDVGERLEPGRRTSRWYDGRPSPPPGPGRAGGSAA